MVAREQKCSPGRESVSRKVSKSEKVQENDHVFEMERTRRISGDSTQFKSSLSKIPYAEVIALTKADKVAPSKKKN